MKLHIVNGDNVAEGLQQAGLGGVTVVYADVLHEGPVPPDDDPADFRALRARYLTAGGGPSHDDAQRHLAAWEEHVARLVDFDEVVLWYEHDLFDQLLLVRLLSWWDRHAPGTAPSLVSPADYLGMQTAAQLVALFDAREPSSRTQLAVAAEAWRAITASEPVELVRLLPPGRTAALPHLAGAVRRLLEEYPSPYGGLGRTERQILEILVQSPLTSSDLFRASARREERVFMGDSTFFLRLDRMCGARRPLVRRSSENGPVEITGHGRRVLRGELDDVAVNGIDKWIGGVHLTPDNVWRWNGRDVKKA